jgi:energy-coupling factor transport system permease protein
VIADHRRVQRALHPAAWWLWAIGLGTAVSATSNPLVLLVALAVIGYVVAVRRTDAPWARGLKYYIALGLGVVVIRIVFRSVFGGAIDSHSHVLFHLPQLPLPHWAANVQLGGPVSLESTLNAAADGMRLAVLLCCIGAANTLANPRRALRILPGALYELGVAVVVCISVAPQLVESGLRVRRARRLRAGHRRGLRGLRSIVVPVVEDAFDRSLRLAAAMDSRGYGRTGAVSPGSRRTTAALMVAGMVGLALGLFGLLDSSAPGPVGVPTLIAGAALCCAGLGFGGRRISASRYRPDPWRLPEWIVVAAGAVAAVVLVADATHGSTALNPTFSPLHWPSLPLLPTIAILTAAVAGIAAPPPPSDDRYVLLPARAELRAAA